MTTDDKTRMIIVHQTAQMTVEHAKARFPKEGTIYAFCQRDARPMSDRWICVVGRREGHTVTILEVDTARDETGAHQACARMMENREWEETALIDDETEKGKP